ncbi:MAG: hypothetical protein D3909_03330 [Candidatus Electrothrix sp. ATG1]|nr:hypothetical protein [Candidatus Electrothrix sp. ATG1]
MVQEENEENLAKEILVLTFACPLDYNNPNCPLKEIRTKEFNERVKWIERLSLHEKEDICHRHEVCLFKCRTKS